MFPTLHQCRQIWKTKRSSYIFPPQFTTGLLWKTACFLFYYYQQTQNPRRMSPHTSRGELSYFFRQILFINIAYKLKDYCDSYNFQKQNQGLLWFKQAEARFSVEKLGSCAAAGAGCADSAQFIRPSREWYGLRYKRRTKHLPKSTVMLLLAFYEYFATK